MTNHVIEEFKSPYFTSDHAAFRTETRRFFDTEVVPHANEWEKKRKIPRSIWRRLADQGLLGLKYPTQFGGRDLDIFHSVVFLEELGRTGYGGFRAAVSVHSYMATAYVDYRGTKKLKSQYLSSAILGEMIAALAITEPAAGSDIGQLSTSAERRSDGFLLNGEKAIVTNGTTADFYVVAARTSPQRTSGISLFAVDADTQGVQASPVETIGWHCSDPAILTLVNVKVPAANIIGEENCGTAYIAHCMQLERLAAATMVLGESELVLDRTMKYLRGRQAFGAALSSFQAIRHRLADLATELAAARQLVYHTAWRLQRGQWVSLDCAMAKLHATELAKRIVDSCLQMHGGRGYLEGSAISRMYRDVRATTIAGGASEIMREIIARSLLGPQPN